MVTPSPGALRDHELPDDAWMSCHASSCRELVELYGNDGGSSPTVQRAISLVGFLNDGCEPADTSPQRPSACAQACDNAPVTSRDPNESDRQAAGSHARVPMMRRPPTEV